MFYVKLRKNVLGLYYKVIIGWKLRDINLY